MSTSGRDVVLAVSFVDTRLHCIYPREPLKGIRGNLLDSYFRGVATDIYPENLHLHSVEPMEKNLRSKGGL